MTGLNGIGVVVADHRSEPTERGNALPILHEIRHGLRRLSETGEPTLIDLHALPFGPGDEKRLLALLGPGEVDARIETLGHTRVWETAFPGVWLVDHRNAQGERLALHIEISSVPEILRSQREDVADALTRLDACIAAGAGAPYPSPTNA
jgi:hydrogenase-1 operon protein HyaF